MWKNIYNQRITILNKLKRVDTDDKKLDVWYKHTVDNAAWYEDSARNSGGNGVYIGTYITVFIPFSDNYIDYRNWKQLEDKDKNSKFTMSSGDYIVLGDVEEEITASNVVEIMKSYEGNYCIVRHIKRPHKRFNATVQLKIEGV
jgi:hypothetical protein